jgi:type II secretory pathway component PulL
VDPEPAAPAPVITVPVPQADRHLLALHALRQRQLRTTFLHGCRRTWRDRRRIWPAVVIALALVALIVAGTSVVAAFHRQQQVEAERSGKAMVVAASDR